MNGTCQYPPSVLPGQPCPTGHERCSGGSSCVNGVCVCPLGTVAQGTECSVIERVNPGQACSSSKLCQGYSVCVNGICICPSPFVVKNGNCVMPKAILAGESCANGGICGTNAYCTEEEKVNLIEIKFLHKRDMHRNKNYRR